MKTTWRFVKDNFGFLIFGITLTFCSSLGQSYFFGVYNSHFQEMFGLTNSSLGSLYGLLTLISAVCLMFVGRWIDHVPLPYYVAGVVLTLSVACILLGLANSFWVFVPGFFLARFAGQGLMGHTASTSMARYFEKTRGRAVTISGTGFHLGAMIMPGVAVVLIGLVGWQDSWKIYAGVLLCLVLPFVLWLLRRHSERHDNWLEEQKQKDEHSVFENIQEWTHSRILRDWRFYSVLPALLANAIIITGLMFFMNVFAEAKGWPLELLAGLMSVFAMSTVVVSLTAGHLVDHFGSKIMTFLPPLPLTIGLILVSTLSSPVIAVLFMILAGASVGFSVAVGGSIWAELYGVKNMGAIKSLYSMLLVLSTSIVPPLMGTLIDEGVSFITITWCMTAYCFTAILITMPVVRRAIRKRRNLKAG